MEGNLMRYVYWAHVRVGRLLAVVLALLVYLLLLSSEALLFLPRHPSDFPLLFGFSSLVALLFLAVGALVWLYARDRRVALLLFGYCITTMATFAVEMGSVLNDPLSSAISSAGSVLSLSLFSALLLLFPRNYLFWSQRSDLRSNDRLHLGRSYYSCLLRAYLAVLTFLSAIVALSSFLLPQSP